jgi:type IV secretory pathway VirB10-like protein
VSNNPKDSFDSNTQDVKPIEAPGGLDLHPKPNTSVRISRRAGLAVGLVVLGLLLAFAYGGYRRQIRAQAAAHDAGLPSAVGPATASATEVEKEIPVGNASLVGSDQNQLQAPGPGNGQPHLGQAPPGVQSCGFDPRTGQPYRFNPETGQPCTSYTQDRVAVRQPPQYGHPQTTGSTAPEPTAEERRIAAAYQREQEALIAPTSIRSASGGSSFDSIHGVGAPPTRAGDLAQVEALSQALGGHSADGVSPALARAASPAPARTPSDPDYESQNMQTAKAAFLTAAQQRKADDYLRATRTSPLSSYEIKAGWEIPAVLEQSLNSDLPGDIKALIASNVFDTASGRYLLIPQGARLVGKYDSRISYGQDGVQVEWDRIIFPDASSMDINGMVGLDSHGNSGLRYDVDHHYKRLFGFAALTSAFSAAFDLSQRNTQSALTYPSVGDTATASIGREMSQTGAMITRRNLNVQPTVKVPVGYKFTVRVNRDIVFDVPYAPIQANPLPIGPRQLRRRTGIPGNDSVSGH